MKKRPLTTITKPERRGRRVLRLTPDTVRVLRPDALTQALSGCVTTSWLTGQTQGATGAC